MPRVKNATKGGIALIPSAYLVDEIVLTNKLGDTIDIQSLVTEFSITESIYSQTLLVSLSVKDPVNLVESFPIYGQETIRVSVYRQAGINGPYQEMILEFYVTEYPLFGRPKEQHTQVFTIRGISKHAFVNTQRRISRAWFGPTVDEILKVYGDCFGLSVIPEGGAISEGQGIINIQQPMRACDWFRRRTYDANYAPFYLYQIATGEIKLSSHTFIANQPPFETYTDSRDFNVDVATDIDYQARKQRVVDVSSDLNLSKYFASEFGAYASENNFLDIATKSFSKKYYSYTAQFPFGASTVEKSNVLEPPQPNFAPDESGREVQGIKNINLPPTPTPFEEEMDANLFSYMEHISRNTLAFEGAFQNYNTAMSYDSLGVLNAFRGVFNTYNHDLVLFGDMDLHAGAKIELKFPRAADPSLVGKGELYDQHLSGFYIVTSVIHEFKEQEYYTKVRVKRDSVSQ
jgi:hypothetical protein